MSAVLVDAKQVSAAKWELRPLTEVADILDSQRVPVNAKERETRQGSVPYYGATGQVGWIDEHIFEEELVLLDEDGAPFLESNKVKAYVIRGKTWVNNHAHVLRARAVPTGWLAHYLNSISYAGLVTGTTRLKLTQEAMRNIHVPVARPHVMESVVAEIEKQFSRLDEAVANLKRVKANLKRYKAAVLKAAVEGRLVPTEAEVARRSGRRFTSSIDLHTGTVGSPAKKRAGRLWGSGHVPELTEKEQETLPEGWLWTKVRDLGYSPEDAVQVGPMSMKSSEFAEAGVPVLNVGCVQWGSFDETKLNYLPHAAAEKFSRYRIQSGDVLFTRSGTVGRCAVAQEHQGNWLMTFHLLRARPDPRKCLPDYLRAVFEGASHVRRQTREASVGSTRAGFNTNLLAMLDVPLPPLLEQERIVAEIDSRLSILHEVEAEAETNMKRAQTLRQAILAREFRGELGVNETLATSIG